MVSYALLNTLLIPSGGPEGEGGHWGPAPHITTPGDAAPHVATVPLPRGCSSAPLAILCVCGMAILKRTNRQAPPSRQAAAKAKAKKDVQHDAAHQ